MKFLLFLVLLSLFSILQAEDSLDQYIQCRRDTEVRVLLPKSMGKDPCSASAVVQGISYECGKLTGMVNKVNDFFEKLNKTAKSRCEDFCEERAKGCKGKFVAASKCGFTIPEEGALEYGKTLGKCSPKCSGQAFIYCSIYHAETLRYHEEFLQNKTPNCYCEK